MDKEEKKGRKGGTLTTRWVTQTLISAATETYLPTFILMAYSNNVYDTLINEQQNLYNRHKTVY